MALGIQIQMTLLLTEFMDVMGVVLVNSYTEAEELAFAAGIEHERNRLIKIFDLYHKTFCEGSMADHPECEKSMNIKYIHQYLTEKSSLRRSK